MWWEKKEKRKESEDSREEVVVEVVVGLFPLTCSNTHTALALYAAPMGKS